MEGKRGHSPSSDPSAISLLEENSGTAGSEIKTAELVLWPVCTVFITTEYKSRYQLQNTSCGISVIQPIFVFQTGITHYKGEC